MAEGNITGYFGCRASDLYLWQDLGHVRLPQRVGATKRSTDPRDQLPNLHHGLKISSDGCSELGRRSSEKGLAQGTAL
jgi:hypothetical protein